jgi:hypothetical protein
MKSLGAKAARKSTPTLDSQAGKRLINLDLKLLDQEKLKNIKKI